MKRKGEPQYIQKRKKAAREKRDSERHADRISALDAIKQSYVDTHKDDKSRERRKGFREYLTIGLLVMTVIFTGLTYWVFKETEINQLRPWIIVKLASNYRTDPNGGFDVDISMKNYGQGVASNVLMTGFLTSPDYGFLDRALARQCTDEDNTRYNNGFQLAQTDSTEQPVNLYNKTVLSLGSRNTVVSDDKLQRGDYLLLGCITYSDQFKMPYETKFCFRPSGPAKSATPADVVAVPLKACGFFDETK